MSFHHDTCSPKHMYVAATASFRTAQTLHCGPNRSRGVPEIMSRESSLVAAAWEVQDSCRGGPASRGVMTAMALEQKPMLAYLMFSGFDPLEYRALMHPIVYAKKQTRTGVEGSAKRRRLCLFGSGVSALAV